MKNRRGAVEALEAVMNRYPDRKAVVSAEKELSYKEIYRMADNTADLMCNLGIEEGDTVVVFMSNSIEYIAVFLAAVKRNLYIAPANAQMKTSELNQLIKKTLCTYAFVCEKEKEDLLNQVDPSLPVCRICLGDLCKTGSDNCKDTPEDLAERPKGRVYLSTSGSTGHLKFVVNTYENEIKNALLYTQRMGVGYQDVIMTGLPFSQKFGLAAMLGSLLTGATLLVRSYFSAEEMLPIIENYRVSVQYGVPTVYIKEMEAWNRSENPVDLSSLRVGIIAGASGNTDIFRWFEEHAGCRLLNCYGTSEVGGITMTRYDDPDVVRYGSCGSVFDKAMIDIVDETGRSLPPGIPGEIVCCSEWSMSEYLSEEELTRRVFDKNGRFLTGDIGVIDENNNLIFSGRKKDIIIRGGYNIFPKEIEIALSEIDDISESCVMGYKDPCLGERICAFVSLKEDRHNSGQEIRNQLKKTVSKYKLPDRVIVLEDLPKLPNGKHDRQPLKKIIEEMEIKLAQNLHDNKTTGKNANL